MNFEDESYVRLYVRDTTTWLRLRFPGQTVLMHLLRKVDRAGVVDGISDPVDDVELLTGVPHDIVVEGLKRLLDLKVIERHDERLVLPKFVEAQTATKSDATRAREMRARRRDFARKQRADGKTSRPVTLPSPDNTSRRPPSRAVTPNLATPGTAKQREGVAELVANVGLKVKFRRDWQPKPAHIARAQELGIPPARFDEIAQHAKLADYPRGFTNEDDVFMRKLLFERQDRETQNHLRARDR